MPDESRGERLIVLYLQQDGLEVRPWCQQLSSRGLPNLWIPSERDFYAVPELPVLGSGKLNLQGVKEMALERCANSSWSVVLRSSDRSNRLLP